MGATITLLNLVAIIAIDLSKQDANHERLEKMFSIRMKGAEVVQLHQQLRRLGYTIPQNEIERHYFWAGTKKAVLEVQVKHGLQADRVVDEVTAL